MSSKILLVLCESYILYESHRITGNQECCKDQDQLLYVIYARSEKLRVRSCDDKDGMFWVETIIDAHRYK